MSLSVLLTIAGFLVAGFAAPVEPGATPDAAPIGPGCTAPARYLAEVVALGRSVPAAAPEPSLPNRVVAMPDLAPVDAATAGAVLASATATATCLAEHEPLRALAGFSDGYVGRLAGNGEDTRIRGEIGLLVGEPGNVSITDFLQPTGHPEIGRLADSRVGILLVFAPQSSADVDAPHGKTRVVFVFVEGASGWLLDDVLFVGPDRAATPVA